ncbi:serine hydrolase domain-containing protein [Polaromonas sp. DSR2-3-2]|uniref:serine hydrolase domain-containing protein n=1 Tax=unclassified Polaromonas TaxID=2638319 RepID=UPI003CEBD945
MKNLLSFVAAALLSGLAAVTQAAPDEDALGKAWGYPVARNMAQAQQEAYRVGSFSAMDSFAPHCVLQPSIEPLALSKTATEPAFRYRFEGRSQSLDDYMQRQRATAVLVLKDGDIVAERYNYGRTPQQRMLSNSMAKSIVALAVVKALEEGRIHSLDDTAATYAPVLAGTLYGETRIINLLRMASGAQFVEDYSGHDDLALFGQAVRKQGAAKAAQTITVRAAPEGERFNYASAETQMLGLVLRGATGRTLCDYVAEKIWQPMGAESMATWLINPLDGVEYAAGNFNATVRDYARLGWLLANDGQARGQPVIARDQVLAMTDAARQPEIFRPGRMINKGSTYMGYGLQTWLLPGSSRRFVLLGIYGQAIFVDPALKLVIVHMAVGKDASGDASGTHLGAERDALWRGIVARYGNW